jgi:hypothetical protein
MIFENTRWFCKFASFRAMSLRAMLSPLAGIIAQHAVSRKSPK